MGAFTAPLKAILYLFALYIVAVHINILVHLATTNDDVIAPTKDDTELGVDMEATAAASEGELVPPPALVKSDPPSHTTTKDTDGITGTLPSPTLNSPQAQQQAAVVTISPDGSQTILTPPSTKKPKKKKQRRTKKLKKVIKPPPIIEKKIVTVIKKEKQRMVLTKDELMELRDQMVPLSTSKAQTIVNKVQDMMTKHTEAKSLVEGTLPNFRRQHEEFFQHFHKEEHPPQDTELELMERHYTNMLDITTALSLQSFSNLMEEELVTIFGDAISRLDGMIEKIMNDELLDDDLNTMFGVTGKMIDDTGEEEGKSVLSFPPVCDVSFLIPPDNIDRHGDDTDKDEDGAAEVIEEEEKEKKEVVEAVEEVEVIPPDIARESDLNNAVTAIERTIRHRLDSLSDVTSPLSSKGTENVRFLLKDRATAIWKERMAEEKAEKEALLKEQKAREMELMKNMDCVDVEEVNLLVEEGIDALFRKKDLVETLTSLVQMLEEEMGGGYSDDDDDAGEEGKGMLDVPLIPLDDGGAHDASGSDTNKNVTVRQLIDTALLHKSADGIDYIVENLGGYIDLLDMAIDQIAGDGGDGDSSVGKASIAALMDVLDKVQIPEELRSVYEEARGKAGILWNQV